MFGSFFIYSFAGNKPVDLQREMNTVRKLKEKEKKKSKDTEYLLAISVNASNKIRIMETRSVSLWDDFKCWPRSIR